MLGLWCSGRNWYMEARQKSRVGRLVVVFAVLLLGAYWAGARWGQRQPISVEAVPRGSAVGVVSGENAKSAVNVAARDAALTDDEAINVRVYRQTAPAVANVLTKATEYDFFMDPVPVE